LIATAKDAVHGTRSIKQAGGRNNLAPGTSREGLANYLGIEMVRYIDFKFVRGRQLYVLLPKIPNQASQLSECRAYS
jgi:hypothetical protein